MSASLAAFIMSILRTLIPAAFEASKPTSQDGDRALESRGKLRASIRKTWGSKALILLLLPLALSGCLFTDTIYIPHGTPVRLRETVQNVKVWVLDKDGTPVASKMDLPEGWFVLPMPEENEGDK
jgi:hypothetical protein